MIRRRLFITAFLTVCAGLLISLFIDHAYYRRLNREHHYKHGLYNHFIFEVYTASGFGSKNHFPGFQKSSVDMAKASVVLSDLALQASTVEHAPTTTTKQINEDASFLSYISLALVGKNVVFLTGSKNKTKVTITPAQAKSLIYKIDSIIQNNVVNGSDIPDNKINAVYSGIHNLFPQDFKNLPGGAAFAFSSSSP